MPIAIAITVSSTVPTSASRTLRCVNQYATTSQRRFGAVTKRYVSPAPRTSTTAAPTQRHGWRTGIALIASGDPVRSAVITSVGRHARLGPGPRAAVDVQAHA